MAKAEFKAHERRNFTRHLINARVMLVHSKLGEIKAKTRDISDSGVFVEIARVPKLPNGAHIRMHMLDSRFPKIAFNMKVVRITQEGLGLMFIDYELDGERYSMQVLRKQMEK